MKTIQLAVALLCLVWTSAAMADDGGQWFMQKLSAPDGAAITNSFTLPEGVAAELIATGTQRGTTRKINVWSDTAIVSSYSFNAEPWPPSRAVPDIPTRIVVVGPCIIAASIGDSISVGAATFTWKLTPNRVDPNNTLLIPPSEKPARIAVEVSTNLLDWSRIHTVDDDGTNAVSFYRLVVERQGE